MNEASQLLIHRLRSVRSFKDTLMEPAAVTRIVQAAMHAPTDRDHTGQ